MFVKSILLTHVAFFKLKKYSDILQFLLYYFENNFAAKIFNLHFFQDP